MLRQGATSNLRLSCLPSDRRGGVGPGLAPHTFQYSHSFCVIYYKHPTIYVANANSLNTFYANR